MDPSNGGPDGSPSKTGFNLNLASVDKLHVKDDPNITKPNYRAQQLTSSSVIQGGKPKFDLNTAGLTGMKQDADRASRMGGYGVSGITPMNESSKNFNQLFTKGGPDAASSMISQSPMNAASKYGAGGRVRAGQLPTPMGSDFSRAKFDFSGYDPDAMRKKKTKSPERKVIVKEEDDMEVFTSDFTENPEASNFEKKNVDSSTTSKEKA